jgi:hypothetical protein
LLAGGIQLILLSRRNTSAVLLTPSTPAKVDGHLVSPIRLERRGGAIALVVTTDASDASAGWGLRLAGAKLATPVAAADCAAGTGERTCDVPFGALALSGPAVVVDFHLAGATAAWSVPVPA